MNSEKKVMFIGGGDLGPGTLGLSMVKYTSEPAPEGSPFNRVYTCEDAGGVSYLYGMPDTCKERREIRSKRRLLTRRHNRNRQIREFFRKPIEEIDPDFFRRLDASRYLEEDKPEGLDSSCILFNDPGFRDKDYFKKYRTVYHLRQACLNGEVTDPRLLYLAVISIVNNPGHFLDRGTGYDEEGSADVSDAIALIGEFFGNGKTPAITDSVAFRNALIVLPSKKASSAGEKKTEAKKEHPAENGVQSEDEVPSDREKRKKEDPLDAFFAIKPKQRMALVSALRNGTLNPATLFANTEYGSFKMEFSAEDAEAGMENLASVLSTAEYEVVCAIQTLYSWARCRRILMTGEKSDTHELQFASTICDAKVCSYNAYHEQLNMLKTVCKALRKKNLISYEEYDDFFNGKSRSGYGYYSGHILRQGKKISARQLDASDKKKEKDMDPADKKKPFTELFYERCRKYAEMVQPGILEEAEADGKLNEYKAEILRLIDTERFLIPQRTKDNSVIPYQLMKKELEGILAKAEEVFPFLKEKGEKDLTVSERILAIAFWRIPYWAGPLGVNTDAKAEANNHSWAVHKEPGAVRPWNFEEKIDVEKTAEEFIRMQTGKCTYLPEEDVLPMQSILYSKYMVLNELNKVKVADEFLPTERKQAVFNELFLERDRVSLSAFVKFLNSKKGWYESTVTASMVKGLAKDDVFMQSMKSYRFFRKYIEGGQLGISDADTIIGWLTVFPKGTDMAERRIRRAYGKNLSDDDIARICRFSCSGWGRLSRKLLEEVKMVLPEFPGKEMSVMEVLWETGHNLMEILFMKGGFMDGRSETHKAVTIEELLNNVRNAAIPSAIRGSMLYSIRRFHAFLMKAKKEHPQAFALMKDFYIESPRFNGTKGKKTPSRLAQLKKVYKEGKKEIESLIGSEAYGEFCDKLDHETDASLRNDYLYLWYRQLGKSMYTGYPIELKDILFKTNRYDRDHVMPESKTGLNDMNNIVLVEKVVNGDKDDNYPIAENIRISMSGFWESLKKAGLISSVLYARLVRTEPLRKEEVEGFRDRHVNANGYIASLALSYFQDCADIVTGWAVRPNDRNVQRITVRTVHATDVSKMRKLLELPKCRTLNDLHHAQDAALIAVTGNCNRILFSSVYYENHVFNNDKEESEKGKDGKFRYTVNLKNPYGYSIEGCWNYRGIKNPVTGKYDKWEGTGKSVADCVFNSENFSVRKEPSMGHGAFFDTQQVKKGSPALLPHKGNDPVIKKMMERKKGLTRREAEIEYVMKYGGWNKPAISHFVEYTGMREGKKVEGLYPVTLLRKEEMKDDGVLAMAIGNEYGVSDVCIKNRCVRKGSLITHNGHVYELGGKTNDNVIIYNAEIYTDLTRENQERLHRVEKTYTQMGKGLFLTDEERKTDREFGSVTTEDLEKLFDELVSHARDDREKNRENSISGVLLREETKSRFMAIPIDERIRVIISIMNYYGRGPISTTCDLSPLGKDYRDMNRFMTRKDKDGNEFIIPWEPSSAYKANAGKMVLKLVRVAE